MNYRKLQLSSYDVEIEVGVIPDDSASNFLSNLSVEESVSKNQYESFLINNLVRDSDGLELIVLNMDEKEKQRFMFEVLESIYKVNDRLRPHNIVVTENSLMYVVDAVREKGISNPTLPTNPGWFDSLNITNMLDTAKVTELIDDIFEGIKKNSPDTDYVIQDVDIIGIGIPVLNITDEKKQLRSLVEDFIERRCDGNLTMAQTSQRLWVGHVLAFAVPRVDEIIYTLNKSRYMEIYTDNVIMLQLYMSVIKVNPGLSWDNINWAKFVSKDDEDESPGGIPRLRRPAKSKAISPRRKRRSSKEEVEESRTHFSDIEFEKILNLPKKIKKHIIAQDEAVDELCDAICVARVGLRGDVRPIGSFLLAGPTGVGKTELSKVLAQELTGREPIRIDCSEYQTAHEIAKLFGSPPGYVGFEDNSRGMGENYSPPVTLASRIRQEPFSVVLFDEIEKADEAIFNVLLQIMDDGRITSGRGDILSFNEAVIIMTSNIGTKEAARACSTSFLGFGEDCRDFSRMEKSVVTKAIEEKFKPEFRNRLSATLTFGKLDETASKAITSVLLHKTKENLEKAQHISMKWDNSVEEYITTEGFSDEFGARNLERTIQKKIELPLARWLLDNYINEKSIEQGTFLKLKIKDDDLVIKASKGAKDGKKTSSNKKGFSNVKDTSTK